MAWRRLMGAVAMGVAMLLVPVAASAHGVVGHAPAAGERSVSGHGAADQHEADCLNHGRTPANGNRLHCHLLSLPAMAAGAKLSGGHDPAKAPSSVARVIEDRVVGTQPMPAAHFPIAAVPRFILFGNFRS